MNTESLRHLDSLQSLTPPFYEGQVLWSSVREACSLVDLTADLTDFGALPLVGGRYAYRGAFALALEKVRQAALDIGLKQGFEQWYLPKVVPQSVLEKFGCVQAWPYYLLKVVPFVEDLDPRPHGVSDRREPFCLDPVQCAPVYEVLEKYGLLGDHPLKIVDLSGYTYRNEYEDTLDTPVHTVEFLRAEYVFVGRGVVREMRRRLLEQYFSILDMLGMKWRLIVGKGCYDVPTEEDKRGYAEAADIEDVPVLDIEVYSASLSSWVETVGASHSYGRRVEAFGSPPQQGYESGCVGVGLTRFAALCFEYLGPEPEKWQF
ncbi:MAG: hypothetical protein GWP08_09205 [Nitrospiraceae bacterium]|nr:hypothetical protein [Nitrospiraceae bacterium]